MTYFPPQSGPCVICGDTNYGLSCGGPTICPKCDCGHFDAATVEKQAKTIAGLRDALESIWKIVHTPTKDTRHRSASDHFQADFDAIRKITALAVPRPERQT